jgi:small conductance mechanosensitive channel
VSDPRVANYKIEPARSSSAPTARGKGTPMNRELDSLEQAKGTLIDLAIRFGPKLLVAMLIMAAGVVVGAWVARATGRGLHHLELEPPVRQLLTRLVRVLVFGLFAILALQNLGVELLPLIAGLSVAGAGIALAMQGVLGNVVAGLTIIFTKPYRVGEYIAIVGVEGRVDSITMFSTTLLPGDRSRIVVPNRKVVGEILHNYGRIRQATLQVGVAYDSDLPRVLGIISDLVRANPRVLADPAPVIQVVALGDSAVQIAVKPWVAVGDFGTVDGELNVSIVEALRERDISIPYPQREVRLIGAGTPFDRALTQTR